MARARKSPPTQSAQSYRHTEADLAARPEIGAQAHFKKSKLPTQYRFDSSLAPVMEWDGQNPSRERAEALIHELAAAGLQLAELSKSPASKERDKEIAALKSIIKDAESSLRKISGPFLNWSGKAERLSFDVPTLPLFVHERLSTSAILDTLKGHKRDQQDDFLGALYGSPERSLSDQVLRAYEYRDDWVNRLILGDSLVVMNSLLRYESLGGQVQMIYVDPPYGVKFGSNFQPFVRKRDVAHNDDADMTREPEMVQAYRDTWELGLHSYLTYLRDRLLLARELLAPSGSIFVQISDDNLHHVREVMDEVFGAENFCSVITLTKTTSATSDLLPSVADYLLWYARDKGRVKYRQSYKRKVLGEEGTDEYTNIEMPDGSRRPMTTEERQNSNLLPAGARPYRLDNLTSQRPPGDFPVEFEGRIFRPGRGYWKTGEAGMKQLVAKRRVSAREVGSTLTYVRYLDDFPAFAVGNVWTDMASGDNQTLKKLYVVQTLPKVMQRCLLMTTDPGDLVLDPTCGSGTTAFVAEQWGRRWITCDTSRVPLALARQRLLTATFDYYQINSGSARGPRADSGGPPESSSPLTSSAASSRRAAASNTPAACAPLTDALPNSPSNGFVYKRRQNQKGEEVGGIVPHITLKSIANNEPPPEEVLVDRPEVLRNVVRVTGPFSFEATIPTASAVDEVGTSRCDVPARKAGGTGDATTSKDCAAARGADGAARHPYHEGEPHENYVQRMLEVLRKAPVLRLPGNQTVTLKNIRLPAKTLALSAEALVAQTSMSAVSPTSKSADRSTVERASASARPAGLETRDTAGLETGATDQPVAILFGPENGPLSERLVREAWDEAGLKHYTHLYVIGFAIDPKARQFIDSAGKIGVACTYLQATMDLQMGDLLKNMRSSQIFSVCGLPDVALRKIRNPKSEVRNEQQWQVELLGLDTFDPITMDADHLKAADVPAWFLDTDYNGMVFRVRQAFFPRTGAWENLKKSLRVEFEDTVWDHLAGTTSAPFPAGEHSQIAVKVIDPRGNELLVVKKLEETK